ncbi:MAG: FecR family protein [Treponema sp.]|jgi:hypothetical protein|nr:FecR family protein [Treponema sp.]
MRKAPQTARPAGAAVVCACLLGAAACLALFYADLNRSLRRLNGSPVGSVAFQSRAALRRFEDRIIWDRLHRESPVYNGDFIRTAERSEAAVRFSGGEMVNLSENSLIRIFVEGGTPRIEFSQGNISVYTGEGGGIIVSSGEKRMNVPPGAALSFNEEMASPVLAPLASARFLAPVDTPVPVEFTFAAGAFSEEGRPAPSPPGGGVRVEIAGDRHFTRSLTVLETAPGTDSAGGLTAELPAGSWWWRASPAGGEGGGAERTGQFTVSWTPPPRTISPAPASVYYYPAEPPELRFQWTVSEEVQYYLLEAADNPDMAHPVLREEVHSGSLVSSRLGEGQWYWRVTPVFPAVYQGSVPASPVVPFSISRGDPPPVQTAPPVPALAPAVEPATVVPPPEPPAAVVEAPAVRTPPPAMPPPPEPPAEIVEVPAAPPRATPPATATPAPQMDTPPAAAVTPPLPAAAGRMPADGYAITPETLQASRAIAFNWDPVAGADGYMFTLLSENAFGVRQPVTSAETSAPSYTLEDLSLLDQGRFIWQVEAVRRGPGGTIERRGIPGENRFTVDIPRPETPQGRDTGILYGR